MAVSSTCGSIGSYFKILVENSDLTPPCPPATFGETSERYEILNENVQFTDVTLGGNGLTGGVDPIFAHLRSGTRIVYGRILMEVGPYELRNWLPRILGNAGADPVYTTSTTFSLRPFDIMMKRDKGTVIYRHCAVNRAILSARASIDGDEQIMQLGLDIIGYQEHDATYPATEPALPSSTRLYWLLGDGKLTLTGITQDEVYFDSFNLFFDNNLVPQTRNFLRITCLQSRGRRIRLQVSTPYTANSHSDLYINRFTGAGELLFTGQKNLSATTASGYETKVSLPLLYQTRRTPATRGHGEIPLTLDMMAYRDGTTEPITITNRVTA